MTLHRPLIHGTSFSGLQQDAPEEEMPGRTPTSIPEKLVKPWKLGPQTKYLFTEANVVDTVKGTLVAGVNVHISGGSIDYIGKKTPETLAPDTVIVNVRGKFLCPGLIDCHLHISSVPGDASLSGSQGSDPAVSLMRQPFVCKQILDRGFTTVRDTGGATLALKEAIADGVFPGPRVFISGRALSQSGGHGDTRGSHDRSALCCVNADGLSVVCDGVPECIRATREQLRTGADFIKIMAGGGVASPTDRLENTQFTADEIRAISEVARSYGTWVTAHAYTPAAIRHAVENGVTGIEHGNLIDRETAEFMAAKGAWLTPTLVTYAAMGSDRYAGYLPPANSKKNKEVLAKGLDSLKIAAEAGVTMCYGSDLLGPLTNEQSGEFAIRAKVLSNLQVLQSATINAAKMLRQESVLGQVKQGFAADILILNENPLDDVTVLGEPSKHILAVIKDGRVYTSRWSMLPTDVDQPTRLIE